MSEIESLQEPSPKVSSKQFRLAMKGNAEFLVRKPLVEGWEHYYNEIPKGITPVIATTHLSDTDVQIVANALSKTADIGISSQATNQSSRFIGTLESAAGKENFFDIDNNLKEDFTSTFDFNPDNFTEMSEAVKNGKTMIVAAHRPVYDKRELPSSSGIGAVYLAQLTDKVVLPVAVVINSDKIAGLSSQISETATRFVTGKRLDATVKIAEPFFLDPIPPTDLQLVGKLFHSETRSSLSPKDRVKAKETLRLLKGQADMVMLGLASELPQAEQGVWRDKLYA